MRFLSCCLLLALGLLARPAAGQPPDPLDYRPAVLTGADLGTLLDADPSASVPGALRAFAYRDGTWAQIPVQTLERIRTDLALAYPQDVRNASDLDPDEIDDLLLYADPNLLIGADPDPRIDADDQVLLLPSTFGAVAPQGTAPAGLTADRLTRV